jgi:hypothetical protein
VRGALQSCALLLLLLLLPIDLTTCDRSDCEAEARTVLRTAGGMRAAWRMMLCEGVGQRCTRLLAYPGQRRSFFFFSDAQVSRNAQTAVPQPQVRWPPSCGLNDRLPLM